jgi:hypothetical protein
MRSINFCDALLEATRQEMERDPSVFVYGIGVPDHKKIFGSTAGLLEKFGPDRCFDTPLSEEAMTGFGLGAAINGMRPIHIHIRVDFLLLAMNQLVNMVSSFSYSTSGKIGPGLGSGLPAQQDPALVLLPYSRTQSRASHDSARCKGSPHGGDPRRQSRGLH